MQPPRKPPDAGPLEQLIPDVREPFRIQAQWLPGGRLHLNDGPIDLVIRGEGSPDTVRDALAQATRRFLTILDELTAELTRIRTPIEDLGFEMEGQVARRMRSAAAAHSPEFLTPMICVAGAVADEVLEAMASGHELERAYVNNGGDIALHLSRNARFTIGTAAGPHLEHVVEGANIEIKHEDGIGGVATSGLGGRSMTLGIADAVTVLAETAAAADAAATLIANAVDVDDARIERMPANDIDPNSDLGSRAVTTARGTLPTELIHEALDAGSREADQMLQRGLIRSAFLQCESESRIVGPLQD